MVTRFLSLTMRAVQPKKSYLVGETLQLVGIEVIVVPQDVVVAWTTGALLNKIPK